MRNTACGNIFYPSLPYCRIICMSIYIGIAVGGIGIGSLLHGLKYNLLIFLIQAFLNLAMYGLYTIDFCD